MITAIWNADLFTFFFFFIIFSNVFVFQYMTVLYALLVLLVVVLVTYYNYISIWPYYIVIHLYRVGVDPVLEYMGECEQK